MSILATNANAQQFGVISKEFYTAGAGGGGGGAYNFIYTADHASGTNYAVLDGTPIAGTFDASATSSDQNHTPSGTYSFRIDGGDDIYWDTSPNTSEYMIDLWIYPDALGSAIAVFEISDGSFDGNNSIRSLIETDGTVYFRHEGNNVVVSMTTSNGVTAGQWNHLSFRGSVTNNVISVKVNANSWENDGDSDAVTAMADPKNLFHVGAGPASVVSGSGYEDDVVYYESYDAGWDGE